MGHETEEERETREAHEAIRHWEDERQQMMAEATAAFPASVAAEWQILFQNAASGAQSVGVGIAGGLATGVTGLRVDKAELILLMGRVDRSRRNALKFQEFQTVVYFLLKEAGLSPGQTVQRPRLVDPPERRAAAFPHARAADPPQAAQLPRAGEPA